MDENFWSVREYFGIFHCFKRAFLSPLCSSISIYEAMSFGRKSVWCLFPENAFKCIIQLHHESLTCAFSLEAWMPLAVLLGVQNKTPKVGQICNVKNYVQWQIPPETLISLMECLLWISSWKYSEMINPFWIEMILKEKLVGKFVRFWQWGYLGRMWGYV